MNTKHIEYLKQALSLAELRRGFCAPNPCVGAVVVKNDKVIATGYHWGSGYAHAEAVALDKLNANQAKDATLYVTLQPCCHTAKKTPPCTQLIINKKIAQVIYAFEDPNPAVSKEKNQQLIRAGISCLCIPLPEIDRFYESYQFWVTHQQPFVIAKLAMSLDGKIAAKHGARIQLTGETARRFTHTQRRRADAMLTTAKTIARDNPALNVRLDNTIIPRPLYILDSKLTTPFSAAVFHTTASITLFYNKNLAEKKLDPFLERSVRLIPLEGDATGLDLKNALKQIALDGSQEVWLEAGGHCFQSFAKANLLQRAFIYVAPVWLGHEAQEAFNNPSLFNHAQLKCTKTLGKDACFEFQWEY